MSTHTNWITRGLLALATLSTLCIGIGAPNSVYSQQLTNPILFVTQAPTPEDSATVAALFGNHGGSMIDAPRGGDLMIRYPDGTVKNLTQAAGYGVDGLQAAGAVAVRQPCVHWSGTRALFSMVVGGATKPGDTTKFYWQIYEVRGLGETEIPVITKVANQPQDFNNVSPVYGTDTMIFFTSDRTINGQRHLYPALDEYKGTHTNTGLWGLNPSTGYLFQLDHSPSGDFSPFIDSYGRLLIMRWDRLQRDRNADIDALGTGVKGTFNYTDESPGSAPQFGNRTEVYPEPQSSRKDLLAGTNMNGFEFNRFFPWMINEDGSAPETLNHLGRHEMLQFFNNAINDDTNVVPFNYATSGRSNKNPINNFTQVVEDAIHPGLYYGIDAQQTHTHSGGQIISLTAQPTLDPNETTVTYVTDRATFNITPEGTTPNPKHSGFYRNPIPLANGVLIASHTSETRGDMNQGTRGMPVSRYAYRIKTLKLNGTTWVADQPITNGISKSISYWDPDTLVHYSGLLWELDPVEVHNRPVSPRPSYAVENPERQIFDEEEVPLDKFQLYLKRRGLAVAITRDVTHRDGADKQQPFYIRVAGTSKQSPNPTGKIYDVSDFQFYQGDYLRGDGMSTPASPPLPGRRVLPVAMHDAASENLPTSGPTGSVKIASDGSMAAFVPARRALTWEMLSPTGGHVVRERYWVTYQPGDVRTCASCHGTNDAAANPLNPIPQNKPEALRLLLEGWKARVTPSHLRLIAPHNDSQSVSHNFVLKWELPQHPDSTYSSVVEIASDSLFTNIVRSLDVGKADTLSFSTTSVGGTFYWHARGRNDYLTGDWSDTWKFTSANSESVAMNGTRGGVGLSTFPEPLASHTTIRVSLPKAGAIKIALYDMQGHRVADVLSGFFPAGERDVPFDLDQLGLHTLANGTYVLRMQMGSETAKHLVHIIR